MIVEIMYKVFFKDCRENNVGLWQCPNFLFLMMGLINVTSMLGVYIIVREYNTPELIVFSVSAVSVIIFSIGSSAINGFQQIAKANRMKSEFVSIASHQLKAPLSGMRWAMDALLIDKNKSLSDKQLEYLKDIQESTSRMIRLINDLLDISRIESGKMDIELRKVSLSDILKTVIKELSSFALAHNVELKVDIDDNLWTVKTDAIRIKMVMQNFIDNAIKYIGSNNGLIKISLKNKEDKIVFTVKDNGIGIPQKDQKRVFDKFFRSGNVAKRQTIGTGLGLYIAKVAIESSGGNIGFDSKEKEGSTFWFDLPRFNS
ncbi:MAG: HAMP domain-containing sensor histidine kinase [Patescibacteria group bacterium]|nr:HAMP domain-containing sensor histidine kinase [Patescibacteria group bacterium]